MTGLLVSVRSAAEARDALAGGTDLIDIKEPLAGSLGAAAPEVIAQILAAVADHHSFNPEPTATATPISVALGELIEDTLDLRSVTSDDDRAQKIAFAKIGLAGCRADPRWPMHWEEALQRFPVETAPVAVVYADWQIAKSPPPAEVLRHAERLGCQAMLIDTFDKRGPGLLGNWSLAELADHLDAARAAGMITVVGGRVSADDLSDLLRLAPDFIAVRGAVCRGDRSGRLDAALVRSFKQRLGAIVSSPLAPSP